LQLDSQFSNDIANLNKIVTMDAKERREEKQNLTKEYLTALDSNDTKFADSVRNFNKELQDGIADTHHTEEEKLRRRTYQQYKEREKSYLRW
jgi:hypothetical protein